MTDVLAAHWDAQRALCRQFNAEFTPIDAQAILVSRSLRKMTMLSAAIRAIRAPRDEAELPR